LDGNLPQREISAHGYGFVVWLRYALLGIGLFAVIKAAIVFSGSLLLSWFVVVAVQSIPFGVRLIGATPRHVVAAPSWTLWWPRRFRFDRLQNGLIGRAAMIWDRRVRSRSRSAAASSATLL
jgi:hypothetical protein